MSLRVVSVAYPYSPVAPDTVGGAEQVLATIDAELTRQGDCSIVIAHQDSVVQGKLIRTTVPSGAITSDLRRCTLRQHQANLDRVLALYDVDVVHLHGFDFYELVIPPHIPVLVTLHMPLSWYPERIWDSLFTRYHFQCVSHSQRATFPARGCDVYVIENGVGLSSRSAAKTRRNYALALTRVCPEKNVHAALDAGTLAKIPVLVGGAVFPYEEHQRYFREQVEPRLVGGHRFLGRLELWRKARLLREAQCLLVPTLAPETSSLVAMESLAAGTPVVAFPSGALPEIIEDGRTGFLVTSVREMAQAMRHVHELNPANCQAVAEQRFSSKRMLAGYMDFYRRVVTSAQRSHVFVS